MIEVVPIAFLHIIDNAFYRLQISALVPEIFKFQKSVKDVNSLGANVIPWEFRAESKPPV